MEDKIYTITLEDGRQIKNLHLNGNNFISESPISESIFEGNLGTVTISDGERTETHENMQLVQITRSGNEYWFVLIDIPESEIVSMKLRSDIDYLAMMTSIDI